jgi:hypothetical protein
MAIRKRERELPFRQKTGQRQKDCLPGAGNRMQTKKDYTPAQQRYLAEVKDSLLT